MTITSDTTRTQRADLRAHRDAPDMPKTDSEADHLFAEGIALLDNGDHLGASEKVWKAAVTAMLTYSNARGWKPQDWHLHRMLLDIVELRSHELGIAYPGSPADPNHIDHAFAAADMLEAHVAQDGHLLDIPSARTTIEHAQPLLEYFRLD